MDKNIAFRAALRGVGNILLGCLLTGFFMALLMPAFDKEGGFLALIGRRLPIVMILFVSFSACYSVSVRTQKMIADKHSAAQTAEG